MDVMTAVRQLRDKALTDEQIAFEVGCGLSTVKMWASGKRALRTGEYMFKLYSLHAEKCRNATPSTRKAA